ncbi:carbamoyltransferase [Chitinophaga filiformis]|uniref:Carbamoyltransferase n=1 Tax=Chitinophaga filiformis TaxID=104663 RepID=A0ABY4I6H8_CHIFI|nr:carbamoyltransferase [Chitinophaga filiformis]UPK71688.1 carbamoyltransferase [Chitinophaga filiformis]
MSLNIVGISAFYHDSACCILQDGVLKAAVQEERFSRKKNDPDLPKAAFNYCLKEAGITISDIDCIAYYEDPVKKLSRQLWSGSRLITADSIRNTDHAAVERQIREQFGYDGPVRFYEHHLSHAASSYYYSGYDHAAILTVDGVGEWATTTYGIGKGAKLELFEEVSFPDSLGLLYSTITSYLGFSVNSGEYKVMGLAPYGKPLYVDKIRQLIRNGEAGQYELNMEYFDFLKGEKMYSEALPALFGLAPRKKETAILPVHEDIAVSLQVVLEEILIEKARYLYEKTGAENLCMAGGVALNCVANGKILKNSPFKQLFVQPAAGDAGCALGAAALAHTDLSGEGMTSQLEHVYLGPSYGAAEIRKLLSATSLRYTQHPDENELVKQVAQRLAEGKVIGWFHGRMEFGPRSLGARSILADPRGADMRDRINAMVKKREAFRPFAPAVLESATPAHFDIDHPSPFMLETCQVISSFDLPAITHVDGSARVQTVSEKTNPRFAALLKAFADLTGCPILLNTSFNVRDEPIVCNPEEALICFVTTDIDCLILEDFIIDNENNDTSVLEMINQNLLERPSFELNPNVYTFI